MKTGLTLSGAGAKLILYAGALFALQESGIKPDLVSGTSSGSLAAAAWCTGQIQGLIDICMTVKNENVFKPAPLDALTTKACVLDNSPLRKLVAGFIDCDKLRASKTPCFVNATNVQKWNVLTTEITDSKLTDDEIVDALVSSTAVPVAFPPSGDLVDGGVLANYPLTELYERGAERIIMITASTIEPNQKIDNVFDMIGSVLSIQSYYQLTSTLSFLKMVISPPQVILIQPKEPTGIKLLDFSALGDAAQRRTYIQLGYDLAKASLSPLAPDAKWTNNPVPTLHQYAYPVEPDLTEYVL